MCTERLTSTEPIRIDETEFTQKEVNKGLKVLNSELLSDSGRHWLTRALDPFHDTQVEPAGYPDIETASTVVQEINLSMVVSKPSSVPDGSTWDCHIWNWKDFAQPANTPVAGNPIVYDSYSGTITGGTGNYDMAGIIACKVPAGEPMLPSNASALVSSNLESQTLNPNRYLASKCRLVACGFEVLNTTAELYKQGTLTAYRMPQLDSALAMVSVPGGKNSTYGGISSAVSFTTYRQFSLPPSSAAEALLLPGSKQWEAARGSYTVVTQCGIGNDLSSFEGVPRLYLERSEIPDAVTDSKMSAIASGLYTDVGSIATSTKLANKYMSHHNTSGVYLTGLSSQTTLQVNVKFIIEAAPGPRSPFATLAKPSPQYDPEALRLYAELSQRLPVAVPVDMNPDGEWFRMLLGTLGDLSTMASGINPLFGIVGQGLKAVGNTAPQVYNMVKSVLDKERNQKKNDKKKPPNPVQLKQLKQLSSSSTKSKVSAPQVKGKAKR